MSEAKLLGWHWLVEMSDCQSLPTEPAELERIIVAAAVNSGATVVQSCFHRFSPYGLSGVVVIAESHLAVHTWPEYRAVCLDLFSCSENINAKQAVDYIADQLKAGKVVSREEQRRIDWRPS